MEKFTLKGQTGSKGKAEGLAVVYNRSFQFRDVNTKTGIIDVPGHELKGQSVKDKIMVFLHGCGPTTEEWALYVLKKSGVAPRGVINIATYVCSTIGAIIADVPMLYGFDENLFAVIQTDDYVKIDADKGILQVQKQK
jgi:uncharacterized protein